MVLRRYAPSADSLRHSRWLRWLGPRARDAQAWRIDRRRVSRGVAIGAFTAVLVPLGQIPLAVIAALLLRASPLAAASTTFISNPLTFGPIYYAAYQLGSVLLQAVGLRAVGIDHGVVVLGELLVREVAPHLDVAEEAKVRALRDLLERTRDRLDLRVVGRHTETDEPPRCRQAVEEVYLARRIVRQQLAGCIKTGRPGTDDSDTESHETILDGWRRSDPGQRVEPRDASASSRSRSHRRWRPERLRPPRLLPPGRNARSRTTRQHSGCRS